jgi:uncharacterized protein YbjT (DUF2867 family)
MMHGMRVIITGATGMVGEGVLFACLEAPEVEHVLLLSRKRYEIAHPLVEQRVEPDFLKMTDAPSGYDACFYCAGVSSAGMKEAAYTVITLDTPLHVAKLLVAANPQMVLCHVSGRATDANGKGAMWKRVKGRAENALSALPFKAVYHFRPALMTGFPGQKNVSVLYRIAAKVLGPFYETLSLKEVGLAMIRAVKSGAPKDRLEAKDIKALAS